VLERLVKKVWAQRELFHSGNEVVDEAPEFLFEPTMWNQFQAHLKKAFAAAENFKKRAQEIGEDPQTLSYKPGKRGNIVFKDKKMTFLFTKCYTEYEKAQQKLSSLALWARQEDEKIKSSSQAVNKEKKNETERLDQEEENSKRLPALSSAQRADDFIRRRHYDASLEEEGWFRKYNSEGHLLPTEMLSSGFLKGRYQHYLYGFIKLDNNYNYLMFNEDQPPSIGMSDYNTFTQLLSKFNKDVPFFKKDMESPFQKSSELWVKFRKFYTALLRAERSFKKNPLLVKLGTAYQRRKAIVGKMETLQLKDFSLSFREKFDPYLAREKRLEEDLQVMTFHCLKEGFSQLQASLTAPLEDEEFLESFESFEPSFAKLPYYRKIINQLDELIKPAPKIGPYTLS
jgi:hypothetical protein